MPASLPAGSGGDDEDDEEKEGKEDEEKGPGGNSGDAPDDKGAAEALTSFAGSDAGGDDGSNTAGGRNF